MNNLLDARKDKLFFYSPVNFVRSVDPAKMIEDVNKDLLSYADHEKTEINIKGKIHVFFLKYMDWDSNYFQLKIYKLQNVLFNHGDFEILKSAVKEFLQQTFFEKKYLYIEIPSEDILLIQALNSNGFKLIETRLTYFNNTLDRFSQERHPVREANVQDIPRLKTVATSMRNEFDRFHADSIFDNQLVDSYLATYIENSILGFADCTLVSNENGLPSDSFLTANFMKDYWTKFDCKISKIALSAVSAETNRGWFKKLNIEMTYFLRDKVGVECIYVNTQSTNRAVTNTWEQLNYKLGSTTHILSYGNNI